MKRPLFVFAGQSNMMGAAVYQASEQVYFKNSYEYMHKAKRMGKAIGEFKSYGFPSGEFSYKDMKAAYGDCNDPSAKSSLTNYTQNTYFCPSMNNLVDEKSKEIAVFDSYSEKTAQMGVCVAPYIVKGLEDNGYACVYSQIAKGAVRIKYFTEGEACEYFQLKCADFFADSEIKFPDDDTSERVLVWLQGEGDFDVGYQNYKDSLTSLWNIAQKVGFTKFLIIRVDFWSDDGIFDIMKAQEDFCNENQSAYIVTRFCSYIPIFGQNADYWLSNITDDQLYCRDSFYGFANQHINEKGFKLIASHALPNVIDVVYENKPPILEEEWITPLK